jgi:hypothetical protein
MAPLALLPYRVALWTWFVAIDLTLVLGIRALVRFAAPDAGAYVWMASAGIVLASAVIRWGLRPLQPAPLVLGLLCFFVVALHTDRPRTALCIAMGATVAKMTLALPFLGLLALHRRFGAVAASLAALAGLNALGFLRMGASLADYRLNIAKLDDWNNINSMDPWRPVALPRLDWSYLFYGLWNNVPLARGANLVASALAFVWLVREGLRARTPPTLAATTLFLAPIVCFGSLCVYHHQYDACLFFAPALLACFLWRRPLGRVWPYALVAPFLLMILFLPVAQTQRILESIFGLRGFGLLKLSFPVVTTVALVGSMAILRLRAAEFERYEVGG